MAFIAFAKLFFRVISLAYTQGHFRKLSYEVHCFVYCRNIIMIYGYWQEQKTVTSCIFPK